MMAHCLRRSAAVRRHTRRGSGYILILGAAMLVSVVGLSSLTLVRVQSRAGQTAIAAQRARIHARSAVETVVAHSMADPSWRSNYATWASRMPLALDRGYCSAGISEPDGSALLVDADTPVLIHGTGIAGTPARPEAIFRWTVRAYHPTLDLLRTALHSGSNVTASGAYLQLAEGPISTNATFTNTGTVIGDVEARQVSNWGWISGTVMSDASNKPSPAAAWSYYRSRSTAISVPAALAGRVLEWTAIGPDSNPWVPSKSSPDGLFHLKPSGDFRIRNCRIVGTLVVELAAGRKLILSDGLLWEPARADYPSLIVNGPCEIRLDSSLQEAGRANFNPPGMPYEDQSDNDFWDSYSGLLRGVFHVVGSSSTVVIENQTRIRGVLIADGPVTIKDQVQLTADPNLFLSPPLMYRASWLELEPGTWQAVTE
ncbi:MAG TPA: hypothetical protein PLQ89_10705 [Phycisphaerae bacterium]|nr:hypothetical protein [Phycisphaerae bacterium]